MAQWERKQAGAIVQAATAYMDGMQDADGLSHLAKIVQLGKAVERTDSSDAQMGIPVDRDHPFRFIVTGDSGGS